MTEMNLIAIIILISVLSLFGAQFCSSLKRDIGGELFGVLFSILKGKTWKGEVAQIKLIRVKSTSSRFGSYAIFKVSYMFIDDNEQTGIVTTLLPVPSQALPQIVVDNVILIEYYPKDKRKIVLI